MGFRHGKILLTPFGQIMGKGHDINISPSDKKLFCLLTFYALFQGE